MKKMISLKHGILSLLLIAGVILPAAEPDVPQQKAWRGTAKSGAKAENFKPVLSGDAIVCGNKTVTWSADGEIRISSGKGVLFSFYPFFVYTNDQKKVDWKSFTRSECRVKAENGKVTWVLKKKLGDQIYDACSQTLEITPEGLLKIQSGFQLISAPGWKPTYQNASIFFFLPYPQSEGKNLILNGKRSKLDRKAKTICASGRAPKSAYVFYPDDAADTIALEAARPEAGPTRCYPSDFNKAFRIDMPMPRDMRCSFTLDIRKGIREVNSPDKRGGIDFQAIENLELPDSSHRNLLRNSSFESGTEGYRSAHHGYQMWEGKWDWKPFEVAEDPAAPAGKHVLRLDARENDREDYRQLGMAANITTHAVVAPAGTYTISFYAKGEKGKNTEISLWVPQFHSGFGGQYIAYNRAARKVFYPNGEWKRYSFTIELPKAQPLEININARHRGKGSSHILLDALQLESGGKATAYEPAPAEGRLVTSSPDNFVSAKEKINGRMNITTAKPNASGKAVIRVRNFFGEELLNRQIPFRSDASGVAEIALPLDDLPGLGVFMLRADYILNDGSKAYEHHRYSKVEFLNNTHPNKNKFSFDYGHPEQHFQFIPILERWKKLGVGAKHHNYNFDKRIMDMELRYGVEPVDYFMMDFLYGVRGGRRKLVGFGFLDADKCVYSANENDPKLLIRDFHHDANGEITPEYLKKFKDAVKTISARNPHIQLWCMAGELLAKFPPEWWSKEKTPEACARIHAQLLKAFVEGVKEGNPKAKVYQDDPYNMNPTGGIAETELLLRECNKIGVKFDVIGIHIYRFSPESPDLDSDTKTMLQMLDRIGYENVPVFWPEGMHWGPFNIPQWGTISSTWGNTPVTWTNILLSYDMGATEKLSAAWYARSWLVALKYGDRILGATAGNTKPNCYMDLMLTPYAAQLVPNTLGNVLGDTVFKKDIRFAPFIRAYVFEDGKKRPVAAVWCHLDKVDEGRTNAPIAEADFGDTLESVIDFMNSQRSFTKGKFRFPVGSFPLFLRGKPGTLTQMIAALENANVVSGEGIAPLDVLANPVNRNEIGIQIRNYLSRPFAGTLNGKTINVPASGREIFAVPLKKALADDAVTKIPLPVTIRNDKGNEYRYDLSFEALPVKKIPDQATFETIDWSKLPRIPYPYRSKGTKSSGTFRIGWNKLGIFIESRIQDKTFVHTEYEKTSNRWKNDCLQIYFDTMANARVRTFKGYDEDDYDYALFPNADGKASIVFRNRSVEQQLGLATQAPPDNTIAADIPTSFSNKDGVLTYRVFFPAKYLLPIKLQKGWVFGFGLYAADSNIPGKVEGALTVVPDGGGCYNKPHLWPAAILE